MRFAAVALAFACSGSGGSGPVAGTYVFPGTAAVRIMPATGGEWLLLLEKLQPQLLVTTPLRTAALVGARGEIVRTLEPPEGTILVDAVAHPSGDVSLLTLRADPAGSYPFRVVVLRFAINGERAELELSRLAPPAGPEEPPRFLFSLDRARLVARGDDLFAVVRWANNSVHSYRLGFEEGRLQQKWAAWVEPPADLSARGATGEVAYERSTVESRIALPRGPAGRGNEAMSVAIGDGGSVAICGVQDAPGTHAEVHSDAFLAVQPTR